MDIRTVTNIDVIKCYKLLFIKEILKKNIGSYIIISILFINIILLIIFIFKGYNLFINKINHLLLHKSIFPDNDLEKKSKNKIKINKKANKNSPPKFKRQKYKSNTKISKKNINNELNKSTINVFKKNKKIKENDKKNKNKNKDVSLLKLMNNTVIEYKNNNEKNKKKLINYNDYEINTLKYENALKMDNRTFFQYYISLFRMKHTLIFTFYTSNDYNSFMIKLSLFLFSFSLYLTVNSLFFTDSTIHTIYIDGGKYNFIYQIPQILYSFLICSALNAILSSLSLTQDNIISIKKYKKNKVERVLEIKKCINIKFIFFFILSFLFYFIFWFFLGCFCAVYNNSQIHLIKDTLISFGLTFIYPLGINLIPTIFRIYSLKSNKNKKCIYNLSKIFQYF